MIKLQKVIQYIQPVRLLPLLVLLSALSGLLAACLDPGEESWTCEPGSTKCIGQNLMRCEAGGRGYVLGTDCSTSGLTCTSIGCAKCEPNTLVCSGADIMRCNSNGAGYNPDPVRSCDASKGVVCSGTSCINACDLARKNRSYVGCEYWAVDLDNAVVSSGSAAAQQFALALSNPSVLTAQVTVSVNEAAYGEKVKVKQVTQRTIKPQALEIVLLPAREVDGSLAGEYDTGNGTAVVPNAYRIVSTVPIIAYQFNPLSNAGVFSNDASLLVPTPALTMDTANESGAKYLVMGWPQTIATTSNPKTNFGLDLRAFLTIVGTRENTQVKIVLTADTVADKAGRVKAHKTKETFYYTLNPFDVLNLETGDFGADFTGSWVVPEKPVVVFSGSEASDVPDFSDLTYRKCCADHLEHQLFPTSTLGRVFIALITPSRSEALSQAGAVISVNKNESEYFRVLSSGEFVKVTTNLKSPLDNISVPTGGFSRIKATQDFTIEATSPVVVGQFVASQDEAGIPSTLPGGDPSFILLPPVEQFRKDYLFLTPNKYAFDFVLVAAPRGSVVTLDGRVLQHGCDSTSGLKLCCVKSEVGQVLRPTDKSKTTYDAYKCQLSFPQVQSDKVPPDNLLDGSQNDGVHQIKADQPVGLVVYGFDAYVSYGYPGGTDLTLINVK